MQVDPSSAARSAFIFLAAGLCAGGILLRIVLEYRQFVAEKAEAEKVYQQDGEAFKRWRARLADKPGDQEMAAWLDCDRKVLLQEAFQHYRLNPSSVIAYAFIEASEAPNRRARVLYGPWRYSRYKLLVFLLTADGVRQLTAKLDFLKGSFHDRERTNYRFDALAAVRIAQEDGGKQTFELTLVSGQSFDAQVKDTDMNKLQSGERSETVSEVTLDAAGIHHTLHVLEGVAAEGKKWIV